MVGVRDVAVRLRRRRADTGPLPQGVCRAPFTSMYLDQHGSVRACCQNTEHPLGNVTEMRLRDIWDGEQGRILRDAMLAQDLDHGCAFCKWQVAEGNDELVFARTFDHLQAESTAPRWPKQLELSMSNACNLQCVMCNGDWSSSIRANREGRPPLPQVYDEQFFDDLRPFLEHIEVVKILGGEPFLGKESLRVMEMLVEMGSTAEVHVTTNGTQWSPRVERILEKLPMVIIVSLDGVEKQSYESIRIGADLDVVLGHIERFRTYAQKHGTAVNLAHCLMTSNWRQFPDFLRYAEERQLRTYVNTVTYPNSLSLFHMPPARLREIVDFYRSVDAELSSELKLNRSLWKSQLQRLEHRLDGLSGGEGVDYYLGVMGFPLVAPELEAGGGWARDAAAELATTPATHVRIDLDHRVVGVLDGPQEVLGVDLDSFGGKDIEALVAAYGERFGSCQVSAPVVEHLDVRRWRLSLGDPSTALVSVFLSPIRDDEGVVLEFDAFFVVEEVEEVQAPTDLFEQVLVEFREEHPDHHELQVAVGRVAQVRSGPSPLGRALGGSVGEKAEDLAAVLGTVLGEMVSFESEDSAADGSALYRVAFASEQGEEHRIEALVVPVLTEGLGQADSIVLVAEVG